MIHICFGLPASCKTVHASLQIVEALKQKRPVYTNIQGFSFAGGALSQLLGAYPNLHFLYPSQVEQFWKYIEPGSLVIIDDFDIANIYHSVFENRQQFFECWFKEHYSFNTDLILIAGSLERPYKFFDNESDYSSFHVNIDCCYRFFAFRLPFLQKQLYSITSVDRFCFPSRTFYSLQSTLSKISAFFEAKP